jgi:predicted ABC-type ATPase
MPTLFIIAGPNGAGKTTASKTLLPEVFQTKIFINADEIAVQLNSLNVESVALKAGRLMLQEIEKCLNERITFAIETTLATRSYLNLVRKAQLIGYEAVLFFFYLPSADMAKQRVALRVSKGGHNIPEEVIERRYSSGIKNLFEFIEIVDRWRVFDNSQSPPNKVAIGEREKEIKILNFTVWERLKNIQASQKNF